MSTLPTLFLSHGSPMHAVLDSRAARLWQELGQTLPRPRAVLIASAHWETAEATLTASAAPVTVHDFGGFPPALYAIRYPAPGAPALAQQAATLLQKAGLTAALNPQRGLDHGAWAPLRHLFPAADIPVVQVSLQSQQPVSHTLAVGAALGPLARQGVLIIGSGHLTHNLNDWIKHVSHHGLAVDDSVPTQTYVKEFRAWVQQALSSPDPQAIAGWQAAPHARRAHPSPEHFLPLLLAWAAAGPAPGIEHFDLGVDAGVLAMDAWRFTPSATRA